MAFKQLLLQSTRGADPSLVAPWDDRKRQSLDERLSACSAILGKDEIHLKEMSFVQRELFNLAQQMPSNSDVWKLMGILNYYNKAYEQADTYISKAIDLNPNDVDNYSNRAAVLRAQGREMAAREVLETALRKAPGSPAAHRNFGNLLSDQGAFEDALDHYRRALEQRPGHQETWQNYIFAIARSASPNDMLDALNQADAQGCDRLQICQRVATWLLGYGRGVPAMVLFSEALQVDETDPTNLRGMAAALLQIERPKDADTFIDKALELDPDDVAALNQKIGLCLNNNWIEQAETHLNEALAKAPGAPALLVDKAQILFRKDDIEGAERETLKVLKQAPNLPAANGMMAQIARTRGDFESAQAYSEKVIANARTQKGGAISGLYSVKSDITEEDDVQSVLKQLEAQETTSKQDLAAYNYTLGHLFHKLKSPERAIFFFKTANDLRRITLRSQGQDYHRQQFEAQVAAMEQTFTPAFFAERRDWGVASEQPVFIVGMPRSGTTLTEQIVAAHPLAFGAGELGKVPSMVREQTRHVQEAGANKAFPYWMPDLRPEDVCEMAESYLAYIRDYNADALRVTDKMPHNFLNVGLIATMFPNARIIHVMRDPVDNCLSCFQQHFQMPHAYSTNLEDVGHHYRLYRRLMAHWRKVLPENLYEVQYEELVADQERVSRELIAFLGLDWDDACLAFNRQERAVKTASVWQVRQPIYTASVKKWKMYEPYIEPLLNELTTDLPPA